ncbi:Abi family protein [Prescottella subtropica]|uniref:Abi family protein n=1 Tax=Prescottella subtropica TaxID=2545757 RepID=UPI0010F7E407|nr:Abi family protein [Prescottella subtropica]
MHNRSTALIQNLHTLLTPERLAPYKAAAGGDVERALDLYEWNSKVSAAVFEDLGYLEVVLRNACHNQLHQWNHRQNGDPLWYRHSVFGPASQDDIGKARQRATRGGRPELPGRVVAELMFGFWRFLHARSYEATLWTPCLRLAYPHLQPRRRQTVYTRLDHLNTLRNRIAHHEPIHRAQIAGTGKDIAGLHSELLEVLGWIDPVIADWVRARSDVPALLHARPR